VREFRDLAAALLCLVAMVNLVVGDLYLLAVWRSL
jgi:hypothetical protein